jgi:hypothetical protein
MGEGQHKAAKGLIKVKVNVRQGLIGGIVISGDFFLYPEDKLWEMEKMLIGVEAEREKVLAAVRRFYGENRVLSPGVAPEDFAEAVMKAVEK